MAKSRDRGNREAKKPKKSKIKAGPAASPFAAGQGKASASKDAKRK